MNIPSINTDLETLVLIEPSEQTTNQSNFNVKIQSSGRIDINKSEAPQRIRRAKRKIDVTSEDQRPQFSQLSLPKKCKDNVLQFSFYQLLEEYENIFPKEAVKEYSNEELLTKQTDLISIKERLRKLSKKVKRNEREEDIPYTNLREKINDLKEQLKYKDMDIMCKIDRNFFSTFYDLEVRLELAVNNQDIVSISDIMKDSKKSIEKLKPFEMIFKSFSEFYDYKYSDLMLRATYNLDEANSQLTKQKHTKQFSQLEKHKKPSAEIYKKFANLYKTLSSVPAFEMTKIRITKYGKLFENDTVTGGFSILNNQDFNHELSQQLSVSESKPCAVITVPNVQDEIHTAKANQYLGTKGVGPCIVICARGIGVNGEVLNLGMHHFSGIIKAEVVMAKLHQLLEHGQEKIHHVDYYMIGGQLMSLSDQIALLTLHKKYNIVAVKFNEFGETEDDGIDVVLTKDKILYGPNGHLWQVTDKMDLKFDRFFGALSE